MGLGGWVGGWERGSLKGRIQLRRAPTTRTTSAWRSWVGGWVVDGKVEENEAVRMSYCGLGMGGWVGGWVGRTFTHR